MFYLLFTGIKSVPYFFFFLEFKQFRKFVFMKFLFSFFPMRFV